MPAVRCRYEQECPGEELPLLAGIIAKKLKPGQMQSLKDESSEDFHLQGMSLQYHLQYYLQHKHG